MESHQFFGQITDFDAAATHHRTTITDRRMHLAQVAGAWVRQQLLQRRLAAEIRSDDDGTLSAALIGVVADTDGNVFGGPFVAGANPICMTFEVTLEEWWPALKKLACEAGREYKPWGSLDAVQLPVGWHFFFGRLDVARKPSDEADDCS
ncbi:hypothetical protein [Collimonas arenae]